MRFILNVLLALVLFRLCEASTTNRTCLAEERLIRKEWHTLSSDDRQSFVSAIQCLSTKTTKLNRFAYPGAHNQFLDFANIRAEKSKSVLLSGFTLSWHRHFLWLFEQTLRRECNYSGSLPYWDFGRSQVLENQTIFDGSDASLSGNGEYLNQTSLVLGPGVVLPPGKGGGCIKNGPFAYFNTTLLPISPTYILNGMPLPLLALESNLNCLVRNFNDVALQSYCNGSTIVKATTAQSIESLYVQYGGVTGGTSLGLINGIGFAVGGQMWSITSAAQDPLFFLVWAMLDRIYASWQASHSSQANDQYGTQTSQNLPPSANVTMDTVLPDWKYLGPDDVIVADLMNTTGGVLCYEYDSLITPG